MTSLSLLELLDHEHENTTILLTIYTFSNIKFKIIHFPCNYVTYIDVCITNLLHNFIFVVFTPTCFGLEFRPS